MTFACPKGHVSAESDFCDTCGARIPSSPAAPPTVAAPPAMVSPPAGAVCPHCGTPRSGSARFCEDCGYDHSTGRVPQASAPVAGEWTATVVEDRVYFDANAIEGVEFPAEVTPRVVTLPAPQVRVGRRSVSKGTSPELDLAADPGVSHNHALLTLSIDGVWLVSDLGSTNGTYLNAEDVPLTAGESRTLEDGDQVHVGAWTTITLHAP